MYFLWIITISLGEIVYILYLLHIYASLMAQLVKNPPTMQENQVRSLGGESESHSVVSEPL